MGYFDDHNTATDTSGATQSAEDAAPGTYTDTGPTALGNAARKVGSIIGDTFGPQGAVYRGLTGTPAQQNAVPDKSLAEPRVNPAISDSYESGYQGGNSAGIPGGIGTPPVQGPLARSVAGAPGVSRIGNEYSGEGTAAASPPYNQNTAGLAYAYDKSQQAGERQDQQQRDNAMINGGRVASSSFDLANAEQAARVSRFRATNGADVVLAPENSGYDGQRKAIFDGANADAATVTALRGQLNNAQNAQVGTRNYIDEFGKQQEGINRATLTGPEAELKGAEAQGHKADADIKAQTGNIVKQLGNPSLDPKQRAALQESLLAIHGKDPNRYQVEHSNGPPVPDQFGGLHPGAQYVHIVDKWGKDAPQTLRADDAGAGGGGKDAVAGLKALRPAEALQNAKQAIAQGYSKDAVNARLKAAGHAELE